MNASHSPPLHRAFSKYMSAWKGGKYKTRILMPRKCIQKRLATSPRTPWTLKLTRKQCQCLRRRPRKKGGRGSLQARHPRA